MTDPDNRQLAPGIVARPIRVSDDAAVRDVIHQVMADFRCTGEGFALHDPEVEAMTTAYSDPGHEFFVVTNNDVIAGCGGFAPLAGGDAHTCELRKMYFLPSLRGRGAGRAFLGFLLERMEAAKFGFCYLETTSWMDAARYLYEAMGFRTTDGPIGTTGHHACDRHYLRRLGSVPD